MKISGQKQHFWLSLVFGIGHNFQDRSSVHLDDRLIIEVVYMVFRVAIAVYLSHKVPRHLAVSTHTSVIASCAFALLCADNHNNNGGIVTSPQHAQRVGSGAVQQCFLFGGAIDT